jgi:uncharacterized protein (DUF433 family)
MKEIVRTDDVLGGDPRLDGTRIGVRHVKERVIDGGEDAFTVAADYGLDVADVFAALAYYYDRPDEMRHVENERESRLREIRRQSRELRERAEGDRASEHA